MINEDGSVTPTMDEIEQILTVNNWIPEDNGTTSFQTSITFSYSTPSEKPKCEDCKGLGFVPSGIGFQDCIKCNSGSN